MMRPLRFGWPAAKWIVTELLKAKDQPYTLLALVRKAEQVEKLREVGMHGIIFERLDDFDTIRGLSCLGLSVSVVVAVASARHVGSAKACIEGLAETGNTNGDNVHYIHVMNPCIGLEFGIEELTEFLFRYREQA
jgi:hypothetical protein